LVNTALNVGSTTSPALGGGLCVMISNSPILGAFFEDPGDFDTPLKFNTMFQNAQNTSGHQKYDLQPDATIQDYKVQN
jgi:hypothetical protein